MHGLPIPLFPPLHNTKPWELNSLPSPICVTPEIHVDTGLEGGAGNKELEGRVEKQSHHPQDGVAAARMSSARPSQGLQALGDAPVPGAGSPDAPCPLLSVGSGEVGGTGLENCMGLILRGGTERREVGFRIKKLFTLCVTLICYRTSGH